MGVRALGCAERRRLERRTDGRTDGQTYEQQLLVLLCHPEGRRLITYTTAAAEPSAQPT